MITEGYLAQHYGGRRSGRDIALLDVCQDYALKYLYDQGVFDFGAVLKGGTSLRKFRAGAQGRFSTDLDFATPDAAVAELVIETLDGAALFDVRMRVIDKETLRARLVFETPLGNPTIPAKLEASTRPLWIAATPREPVSLAVHRGYEFALPPLPVPVREEAIAEKLAAWRRRRKMRDLYDLQWFGRGASDEALVRRLFVLKVWHDVVDDGLGSRPLDPAAVVRNLDARTLPSEDIGLLTQPVDPDAWLGFVRKRYAFVTDLDDDERRVARCSPRDRHFVEQLVASLTTERR